MSWTDTVRALGREIRAVESERASLRKFGLLMAGALFGVGLLALWRRSEVVLWLFIIAAAFMILGLALPRALWPLHKFWMALAIPLGWVMTRLILTLVFFAAITPIALIGRLFGKRFLETTIDRQRDSYWEARERRLKSLEDHRRQF